MFKNLVTKSPEQYEQWKKWLKRSIPLNDNWVRSLANTASTFHQKYSEDFVFIHINKCGGTSIERALGIPLLNHDTALERRRKLGNRVWDERFKFSVVRNPYDRVASLFFYRHRTKPEFPQDELQDRFLEWLETIVEKHNDGSAGKMVMPQTYWISDDSGSMILDFLCRLEDLDRDLHVVREKTRRAIVVPQLNRGKSELDYDELYTADSRRIVNDLFSVDFEVLPYERTSS